MMRLNLFWAKGDSHNGLRRILGALGPTWAGSPVRRIVQAVCLGLFLVLFFYVCWPYGSREYAEAFAGKEMIDADIFLALDPLVSISAAIAARMWVPSLTAAVVILGVCLLFPRGFCGYVCPLGTLLDLFDRFAGKKTGVARLGKQGWWVNLKYYILAAVVVAAVFQIMLAGLVSAMPVVTRLMLFVFAPLQTGAVKGWYLVPSLNAGQYISIALFAGVLLLGLAESRFWCKYLCPTGAVFSLASVFRLSERQVDASCIECGKCAKVCSFAAIESDFSTRHLDCSFCQSCGGACPVSAIGFVGRWTSDAAEKSRGGAEARSVVSRRSVIAGIGCAAAVGTGVPLLLGEERMGVVAEAPIRPPGALPEDKFLPLCVRCGQCIKVCPNNVLQAASFEDGFNGLWAPRVTADWSGCEPSCNNCGQVCPTGAIRALKLEEKRAARIGLAIVDGQQCLPFAGRDDCRLCVDECNAAGYEAIEFVRVGGEADEQGRPVEGTGYLAPVVLGDKCVGCGLCQMRCMGINVKEKKLLDHPAIRVAAGVGKEDRLTRGSYIELREARTEKNAGATSPDTEAGGEEYLPDFLK